jgi:hypothetical protein
MFRSALLILSGNAAASLLLLARNLIIARLIPVADYGVASTFAIAMAVVEMASALGLQQQIVQARNGEDPRFQSALQGFQVLRWTDRRLSKGASCSLGLPRDGARTGTERVYPFRRAPPEPVHGLLARHPHRGRASAAVGARSLAAGIVIW